MSTDYDLAHVCCNCLMFYGDHAGAKCLYEPTYFSPVSCLACASTSNTPLSTAVIESVRYFMCVQCNQRPHRVALWRGLDKTPAFNEKIERFMFRDVSTYKWRSNGNY